MERDSVFKSPTGKEKIRRYYDAILDSFPLEQRYVDTSYGKTFILEGGMANTQPVVLLHGSCSNSAAWLGDFEALMENHHVFAVDIPGEPGNSGEFRLKIESEEYPNWLHEVANAIPIAQFVLVGNSFGGWIALRYASMYPTRIKAMVLVAPSGILVPKQTFLDQTANIAWDRELANAVTDAVAGDVAMPKEVKEFMMLVMEHFIPITGALPVLSDSQLHHISMPVLYIAGTDDVTMDTQLAAGRLSQLVDHTTVVLNKGAHVITSVSQTVIPFLENL